LLPSEIDVISDIMALARPAMLENNLMPHERMVS